jgi:hypothetical protein
MKVYAIEYDFTTMKVNLGVSDTEHRIETYTDVTEFINRTKYLEDKYYTSDLRVYSGELEEVNVEKVLNPF